jgi:hypothetical protein
MIDIHNQKIILTSAVASVNMSTAGEYHIIFNGTLVNNYIINDIIFNNEHVIYDIKLQL